LCERERPDAMTLDLAMPGLDGMGVLRALRNPGASSVPVVVVSAFSPAHGARAVDALAEGAFDLVAKPAIGEGLDVFKQSLCEKVAAAVQSGRRRSRARTRVAPSRARSCAASLTGSVRGRSASRTRTETASRRSGARSARESRRSS